MCRALGVCGVLGTLWSMEVVWELGVRGLGVLDTVVEKCSFCDVFLKVVFKTHVNYNEKVTFRNIRKKKKNELIASELNSFEKVRMRIYTRGIVLVRRC